MEKQIKAGRRQNNSEMSDEELNSDDCMSEVLEDLMKEENGSYSKTESEADNNSEPAFLA